MKHVFASLACGFLAVCATSASAQTFTPKISQTVGAGANTSYFVLNFDNGPDGADNPATDYVFAYDWNYTNGAAPTGQDMITALNNDTGNPLLTITETYSSTYNDYTVDSISYGAESETGNYSLNQSYWEYFESTEAQLSAAPNDPNDWSYAATGPMGRALTPGSYDARLFTVDNSNPAPDTPQAAPEPGSGVVCLLGIGGLALLAWRRRQTR